MRLGIDAESTFLLQGPVSLAESVVLNASGTVALVLKLLFLTALSLQEVVL